MSFRGVPDIPIKQEFALRYSRYRLLAFQAAQLSAACDAETKQRAYPSLVLFVRHVFRFPKFGEHFVDHVIGHLRILARGFGFDPANALSPKLGLFGSGRIAQALQPGVLLHLRRLLFGSIERTGDYVNE